MAPETKRDELATIHWRVQAIADPGDFVDIFHSFAESSEEPSFFWAHPARSDAMFAIGETLTVETSGSDRFTEAATAVEGARRRLDIPHDDDSRITPRFVGGFSFADGTPTDPRWRNFPSLRLFLPRQLWLRQAGHCYLISTWLDGDSPSVSPELPESQKLRGVSRSDEPWGTEQSRQRWVSRVGSALRDIEAGRLQKIVLSREATLGGLSHEDLGRMLRQLQGTRPGCYSFCMGAGEDRFFGSTPELLVRRAGEVFETHALAGTSRPSASPDGLQSSEKNLGEHSVVTDGIAQALQGLASKVYIDSRPHIMCLPEADHLETAINGTLSPEYSTCSALELAGRLHPSAAVCGSPPTVARDRINQEEASRGWYSGGVGWVDSNGDGEFAVALRSALCSREKLTLWAGAGIVQGSDPDEEFAETELKMNAVADALRAIGR